MAIAVEGQKQERSLSACRQERWLAGIGKALVEDRTPIPGPFARRLTS
jgi:hypothetical protein